MVDQWKQYVDDEILPFNTSKYSSRKDCLNKVANLVAVKVVPDCRTRLPCDEKRYPIDIEWRRKDGKWTEIFVQFDKPLILKINEIPDYRFEDFLGGFGGFLGVCVGMSLFSILELTVYTFLYVIRKIKKACGISD